MASKVQLNLAAVRDLLRSREVEEELLRRARRIAAAAGPGFVADSEVERNRARAAVYTATFDAILAEAEDHALLRAVDAGRG